MKNGSKRTNLANRSLPALLAVGSSLAALPAGALELGELTVHSRLGQPLRASIAFALAPNEQIANYCVAMRPGASVSGLPGIGPAAISVSNGVIMLTGRIPVREPMVSAHVVVNCPYSANLSREYMLFIDPLTTAQSSNYGQATVTQQPVSETAPIAVAPSAVERPVAAVKATPVVKDLGASARYQVQPGDSLSTIAQRIENRPIGLWPAVNAIFAANPDAFMNNDPNQLRAGSWLSIPSFDGSTANAVISDASTIENVEISEPSAGAIEAAYADAGADAATTEPTTAVEDSLVSETIAPSDVILDDLADISVAGDQLKPGDIIFDTQLEQPESASSNPNVPTAVIRTPETIVNTETSSSWMYWLGGSGLALIFGLLMFGRRLRGGSDTAPEAFVAEQPNRRRFSDTQTTDTENIEAVNVDFDLSDDSPTHENLALDADLIIGTGLEHNAESDISQDFGFAATSELDIELPFEPVAQHSGETDMLPPLRTDEHSILESEVMPEDDDYDMSVIVDATKMPRPEDVTERDLKAVEIPVEDDTLIAQNYTINKEVDYQVLEQDYEEELTATQALNVEIARAAAEIADRMDDDVNDNDETTALPLASVTELDITAQMPAQNDEISDLEDTGINEAVTVNTAADDDTVEMPVESGKAS